MSKESIAPELDVFQLPVFADADIWPMWPAGKLAELADDIKENGFDHRYPITVAEIDGQWMLLDGRNRREAARIAGIKPPVIVTDIDPKLAVHRSNNQNRDATPGQKAMAFAMAFPSGLPGGRGKRSQFRESLSKTQENYISQARFVLRNNPPASGSAFPQYALDVMAGRMTLTEAYDATQKDVARREEEERIRKEHERKLADIRVRYPELAGLVDEDRLSLSQAVAAADQKDREEEARLAEEERQQREKKRAEREEYEKRRAGFFAQLNTFIQSTSIAVNAVQVEQLDAYVAEQEWEAFSRQYQHPKKDALRTIKAFAANLPTLIQKLEMM